MPVTIIDGQSSAYGRGDPEGGWAGLFAAEAKHADAVRGSIVPTNVLINRAVPGVTLPWLLKNQILAGTAGLVAAHGAKGEEATFVLSAGLNDSGAYTPAGTSPMVSLEAFGGALHEYYELLSNACPKLDNSRIILVGPQPVDEEKTSPVPETLVAFSNARAAEYAGAMALFAKQIGGHYVDVAAILADPDLGNTKVRDGVHTNHEGHHAVYEATVHNSQVGALILHQAQVVPA